MNVLLSPVRKAAPSGGWASGSVEKKVQILHHLLSRVMNSSNVQIVNHPKEIATVHDRKMYLNLAEPWKEKLSVKKEKIRQVV
jgi:hypothetical protein